MAVWKWIVETAATWTAVGIWIRLLFSLAVGMFIGIDRGLKRRGAGIKTHVLVCLGSAIVMLTSEYMAINFNQKADLARLGAQVISGVGFLGVGTILVTEKQRVRGLTTAAGLWTCACVGLAIGIGFVEGAIYALFFIGIVLRLLNRLDTFLQKNAKVFDLYLELENGKSIGLFLQEMREQNVRTEIIETTKTKFPSKCSALVVSMGVDHYSKRTEIIDVIRNLDYIRYVEEM